VETIWISSEKTAPWRPFSNTTLMSNRASNSARLPMLTGVTCSPTLCHDPELSRTGLIKVASIFRVPHLFRRRTAFDRFGRDDIRRCGVSVYQPLPQFPGAFRFNQQETLQDSIEPQRKRLARIRRDGWVNRQAAVIESPRPASAIQQRKFGVASGPSAKGVLSTFFGIAVGRSYGTDLADFKTQGVNELSVADKRYDPKA
jgi:hypothetical protein